jgi:hypothetical protein
MRVRIHTAAGDRIDAEQYSTDNGSTWADIGVAQVQAAMTATTGYTVVRDVLTGDWRAFRNVCIESIGPAGDISQVIDVEVERRIQQRLSEELPRRVVAAAAIEKPRSRPDDPGPPAAPQGHRAASHETGGPSAIVSI